MSYNTRLIISAAAVLALTATACHREELRPTPAPASSLVLTAGLPEFETQLTKSQPVTADSLFAYPFWSSMTGPSEAVPNNSFADGRYYFMIPSEADRIFFSNISEYLEDINVTTGPEPEILIEYVSDTGSCFGHDLIYGHITEYDAAAAEQSIQMQRAVARITPRLCHVIGEDTVATSLNFYYDSVSLTLGGIYQGVRIDTASLNASYYGSDSFSLPFDVTETACTMDGFYTLPSAEGTPTVSLDLLMDGSQDIVRISAPLPEPILANHDYNMTFYLHRDNMDGGITLDVQMNEIVMDVSDTESFDIIEFSSSSLVFEVDAGSTAELTVYSKTGYWSATIPAEVLSYYTVVNTTAGDTATIENPTLNGNSGDVLAFKTLSNISDHETAMIFDIPFMAGMAEAADSYDMTLIQSNGQLEQIEITASTYSTIHLREAYGIFDIYRTDRTEPELVTSVDGHISDLSLSSGGTYLLSGYYIESLEAVSASAVRLLNTPSLSSLHIEYDQASEGLDLSGADRLRSLYLSGNEHITEIDLSGNTLLTDIYCSLSGLERLLLSGCTALTSVEYSNYYTLRYVDVSGCTSLKTLEENLFTSHLDSLDISGSGIEILDINMGNCVNLSHIRIDSSALKTFKYYKGSSDYASINNETLDFSGCTALDSIEIEASNVPVASTVVLDGCPVINSLRINGISNFSGIHTDENTHVERLYLDYCTNLSQLDISGKDIRHAYLGTNNVNSGLTRIFAENTALETLSVGRTNSSHSNLSVISTSGSTSLRELIINRCEQLYLLETEGCENLENLRIYNNSSSILPSLDLSEFTKLTRLYLKTLPNITRLDLRHLNQLQSLYLYDMGYLKTLDCGGLTSLSSITLSTSVPIDTLNLNNCSSLTSLSINGSGSKLKVFKASGMTGLETLSLNNTRISGNISFSFPALETLTFNNNDNVTTLNFAEESRLRRATLENNDNLNLTASNFSSEETLSFMSMDNNSRDLEDSSQSLDLSGYAALDTLSVTNSYEIDTINVSDCSSLTVLNLDQCHYLTGLDITGCSSLLEVDLYNCELSVEAVGKFFQQLPERDITDEALYRITGNPGASADASEAILKNWIPTTNDIASDL